MKQIIAIAAVMVAIVSSPLQAATGWFNDYVLVSIDGGAAQNYWIGGDPGSGTEFNGANFGSLTTLSFGVDMKYWADGGDTRDGGAINVSINGGPFTEYIWTQAAIGGNDYQGTLPVTSIDVTSGLAPGSHTVAVYAKSWGTGGDSFLSNGGANYTANFNVVPEPSTYALLGLAGLGLAAHVVRRRRKA